MPPKNGGSGGSSSSNNIKVTVRVRPFNGREQGEHLCISMPSKQQVLITDSGGTGKKFDFDRAYWSHDPASPAFASQQTLMDELGQELKNNSLEGFNNCLFAYGQTGSGKTHSVLGQNSPPDLRGLLPRIVEDLFQTMDSSSASGSKFQCTVSYLEIYNEHIHDLLVPPDKRGSTELEIHQHPKLGTHIPGLTESAVTAEAEVQKLIDFGSKTRSVGATSMNATSSRSHCIFTFELQHDRQNAGVSSQMRSKLNLVDLAGSERQKKTEATGDRLKEGSMINQSLTNLALVIHKLAEISEHPHHKKSQEFVPFRNSKLTHILCESLSGNSRTVMVAALSPAASNYDETLSTLRFATSVKSIKTQATKNEESQESVVAGLQAEIERLKAQMGSGGGNVKPEEVAALESLKDKYGSNFEDKIEETKRLEDSRAAALADMGLNTAEISESLGLDKQTPQLLNLSEDPSLDGCLIYFLPSGEKTSIGAGALDKIKLTGLGVKEAMCEIKNEDDARLLITALNGRVLLNGRPVAAGSTQAMQHGDRIIFGHSFCFKLVIPKMAKDYADQEQAQVAQLEQALNEVVSEDSSEYQQCFFYFEELKSRVGEAKAKKFLEEFQSMVPCVEEANAISTELKPEDSYRFSVEMLVDVFTYNTDEPECIVRLWKVDSKDSTSPKARSRTSSGALKRKATSQLSTIGEAKKCVALFDAPAFKLRLQHLRELYDSVQKGHKVDWTLPENNPWLQPDPWDVSHLIQMTKHENEAEQHALTNGNLKPTFGKMDNIVQASTDVEVAELRRQLATQTASARRLEELKEQRIQELEREIRQLRAQATGYSSSSRSPLSGEGSSNLERRLRNAREESVTAAQLASKLVLNLQEMRKDLNPSEASFSIKETVEINRFTGL